MSRATWRTMRTPKYEQPITRSPLDGSRGQTEGDLPLHEQEEDHDGNRRQCGSGHQAAPVGVAARAVEVGEPDRYRVIRLIGEQGVGEDVLVPARDEGEDRR